jgi:hypothetical protein
LMTLFILLYQKKIAYVFHLGVPCSNIIFNPNST